jgi:hypothetical protein
MAIFSFLVKVFLFYIAYVFIKNGIKFFMFYRKLKKSHMEDLNQNSNSQHKSQKNSDQSKVFEADYKVVD